MQSRTWEMPVNARNPRSIQAKREPMNPALVRAMNDRKIANPCSR